ncbi:MAG: chorismate mutase [Patescibacteria group bacterium]
MNPLSKIRKEIEKIDTKIIALIKERLQMSEEVAKHKIQQGMKIFDEFREKKLHEMYEKTAKALGIPENLIKNIFDMIFSESKKTQKQSKLKAGTKKKTAKK